MTTFSYTTGNPSNLTAGTTASMTDISGPFTDLRTFLNGANLDGTNIAATYAEPAFSSYKTHLERAGTAAGGGGLIDAATTYVLTTAATNVIKAAASSAITGVFYFDPADWTAGSRSTKLRLRASWAQNATAPGVAGTFGLYPVSAVVGGAVTLGAVTSGSTVGAFGPSGNTLSQLNSGDFTAPVAGYYVIGLAAAGAWAASALAGLAVQMQVRQV